LRDSITSRTKTARYTNAQQTLRRRWQSGPEHDEPVEEAHVFSLAPDANEPTALLARVSGEDQQRNETIQPQLDFLRKHAELHKINVVGIYIDDGVSGTIPLHERPDGRRLAADAKDGRFKRVIVYRLDRLARSLSVLMSAHELLDASGVSIQSATEPFDTGTPFGRAMFQFLGIMAELERSTIAERTARGRDRVASLGQYTGGPIPFGTDLDDARHFVASERLVEALGVTESALVTEVFERVAYEQSTLNAERHRLDALGVPAPAARYPEPKRAATRKAAAVAPSSKRRRTGRWSIQTLSQIIKNPIYKGAGRLKSGNGAVARPAVAIVDDATWQAANDALVTNRKTAKRNLKNEYLLRGLVRCALCGYTYSGHTYDQDGIVRRYYRCVGSGTARGVKGTRCGGARIRADTLERAVWERVKTFVAHPDDEIAAAQTELRAKLATASTAHVARASLSRQLADADIQRQDVIRLRRRGKITDDECEQQLDEIAHEMRTVREQLDAIQIQSDLAAASEAYLSDVGAAIVRMQEQVEQIDADDDAAGKRGYIERLTTGLWIETELLADDGKRQRKSASLRMRLALRADGTTESVTRTPDGVCSTPPLAVEERYALAS
jgi:site-specific DNA recombinase